VSVIFNPAAVKDGMEGVLVYKCDSCGAEKSYLSDSWSEIELVIWTWPAELLHHCLECRSDKREWPRAE
jgi:hypothetical protein